MELHDDVLPVPDEAVGVRGAHEVPLLPADERDHGPEPCPVERRLGGGEIPGIDQEVEVARAPIGDAPVRDGREHRSLVGNRRDAGRGESVDDPAEPAGEEEAAPGVLADILLERGERLRRDEAGRGRAELAVDERA